MRQLYKAFSLLLVMTLVATSSCSGEDPIKAKRIAIENGTNKPDKEDPNKKDPNKKPENPLGEMRREDVTFTFDEWAKTNPKAHFLLPIETQLPKVTSGDPYWASASNMGAEMALVSKIDKFPVHPFDKGHWGQAAEVMTTKGVVLFGKGIIAGALYSGELDAGIMVTEPLKSTHFGQPVHAIPLAIKGYYQWLPGIELVDGTKKNKKLEGQDEATIACVFYDVTKDDSYLDGTNLYTDPRVLAKVKLHPKVTKDGVWTTFEEQLNIVDESLYKKIDLSAGHYRMAIVLSSSARGDEFIGAIGSRLRIDDLTITFGTPIAK